MIKTRVIPVLLHRGRNLVKGVGFNSWRNVGSALQAARIHQKRSVDELIVLSVDGRAPDVPFAMELTEDCFMPLTIGGGVKHINNVRDLLANGADKISIGSRAIDHKFIDDCSRKFGSQAITIAIDANEKRNVVIDSGKKEICLYASQHARYVEDAGAGEILLTSIPRDGTMQGYDLDLIESVANAVSIPVIAAGGAGSYDHMAEALRAGAHAVAAGAMFQFTDATPLGAAEYLAGRGFNMRVAA